MQIYYSASVNGFYDPTINGDDIPEDAVEISEETHASLLLGQSQGKVIVPGDDGYPILQDPPPETTEQLAANAYAGRDERLRIAAVRIAPLQDAVDLGMATEEEAASLLAWKQYRVALNRIQLQEGFPHTFTWPVSPEGE